MATTIPPDMPALSDPDLVALTAGLIDIASPSFEEGPFADWAEAQLRSLPHVEVTRVGDNVVARTELGRDHRVVLAGHLDTVPANGNATARLEGDTLHGLGSADMKSGLAVFLHLVATITEPLHDITLVLYAAEEVAFEHSGLGQLQRERPDLVAGDVAILGEPTDSAMEAGCQGTARVRIRLAGARSHTARPWMGRNAIHRLGPVLNTLGAYEARRPVIDGCEYRESIQAVFVDGGVAGNVVPDEATVTVNLRIAPDRTVADAVAALEGMLADHLDDGDAVTVVDAAEPAAPGLDHPVLDALGRQDEVTVRAKLGWTDVSRFAAAGIPAVNFGPGDSTVAHTAGEHVTRDSIDRVHRALRQVLAGND